MMGERIVRILRIGADSCFSQRRDDATKNIRVVALRETKNRGGDRIYGIWILP